MTPYGTIAEEISPQGPFSPVVFSQRRQIYAVLPRSSPENTSVWSERVLNAECVSASGFAVGAGRVVSLVLPDSVTEIAKGTSSVATFASFASLETLTANKTKTVGDYAFRDCAALKTASLPATVTIGDFAFCYTALASANLPVASAIGASAFQNCYALSSLTLGTALPTLGNAAVFSNAGKDTEGFTVYMPTAQMKTAIDTAGSDWYTALYTGIGAGKFKVEVITPR
jgi:hypothetical protein